MTPSDTVCLLLTCDLELSKKMARTGCGVADIRTTPSRPEWTRERGEPVVLLLDLRHPEAEAALADASPETLGGIVAFGVPESEPFLSCRRAGVFAVEALDVSPELLRNTLRHAILLHQANEELGLLRQQRSLSQPVPLPAEEPDLDLAPLHDLWRASRHFHDIQKLLDQLVEGVAAAGRISRVGVIARLRDEACFRLWAGLRCLDNTRSISFEPRDPLVRWLERHAHLVCRAHLAHLDDFRDRRLLQCVLDEAGAEIIVPLLGKGGLLGWIFVGHRATGIPFTARDLSNLTVIGEQVSTLLENALLVEELAVQKTLAENLLEAIPVGIVAVSEDGLIRWFNRSAEKLLGRTAAETVNCPVEQAGSRIADVVLRTIRDGSAPAPVTWTDPASRRTIRADSHRIGGDCVCLGAMVLLSDVSYERLLHEKQEELERHVFWTDLAAALSHEVRNPLVAISTFAQLLPERYTEPEFRQQFFDIVTGEVSRLNAIITQINAFAHPPKPSFRPIAPSELVALACARAEHVLGAGKRTVECEVEACLPPLAADADALVDGLAHVVVNAQEAVCGRLSPHVSLHVRCAGSNEGRVLVFTIGDNGPGIAEEMRDKLFSPFSTTKPRGLGLGLPLARRSVVDHGGRIDVNTTEHGTTVTITLPLEGRSEYVKASDR